MFTYIAAPGCCCSLLSGGGTGADQCRQHKLQQAGGRPGDVTPGEAALEVTGTQSQVSLFADEERNYHCCCDNDPWRVLSFITTVAHVLVQ